MSLENLYYQIKRIYRERTQSQRMDDMLRLLLEKTSDVWTKKAVALTKKPATFRDQEMSRVHTASRTVASEDMTTSSQGCALVKSLNPGATYEVTALEPCYIPDCVSCRECNVCVHMISCTCALYERVNVCRHIHATVTKYGDLIRPRLNQGL